MVRQIVWCSWPCYSGPINYLFLRCQAQCRPTIWYFMWDVQAAIFASTWPYPEHEWLIVYFHRGCRHLAIMFFLPLYVGQSLWSWTREHISWCEVCFPHLSNQRHFGPWKHSTAGCVDVCPGQRSTVIPEPGAMQDMQLQEVDFLIGLSGFCRLSVVCQHCSYIRLWLPTLLALEIGEIQSLTFTTWFISTICTRWRWCE